MEPESGNIFLLTWDTPGHKLQGTFCSNFYFLVVSDLEKVVSTCGMMPKNIYREMPFRLKTFHDEFAVSQSIFRGIRIKMIEIH